METISKYYILKRNTEKVLADYMQEFTSGEFESFKLKSDMPLLLIEKTIFKDDVSEIELFSRLRTIDEGNDFLWKKFTKNNVVYDYTGIVLIIHEDNKIYFWNDYIIKDKKFVVTAYNRVKGYRVVISEKISKEQAENIVSEIEHCNSIALPEYVYLIELKVESTVV